MPAIPAHEESYQRGLRFSKAGRHLDAIEAYESALKSRPDDTRVLFALGNTARALGMAAPAENFYRRVLVLEPERLEAIVNLANLLRAANNAEAAEAVLAPALARNPESPELHLTLGSVYREQGDVERAEACYRAALAAQPDYAPALCNLADVLTDVGDASEALAFYDRALSRDSSNSQMRLNRAVLHLLRGDLEPGWRDYGARIKLANKVPVATHGLRAWDGQFKRTRLLVAAEQGIGDQVMFASVMPDLAARAAAENAQLILECEPRLQALFARSFPGVLVKPWVIETRAGVATATYDWLKPAGGANAFVHVGTLPKFLRKTLASFPSPHAYLTPDPQEQAQWREKLDRAGVGPFIGICWRSGSTGGGRALQYASLDAWAEFIRDLPGTIVCTQYDAKSDEVTALEQASGRPIFVPPNLDQKNELDRTVAFLSLLDAVVSAPTAVSWLSAATGTPTFKILFDTSWTALGKGFEPFAPACRCVGPDRRGEWRDAFAKAGILLRELAVAAT